MHGTIPPIDDTPCIRMFLHIPLALATPLLKIPILVTDIALTYISLTPPNPPPPPKERDNFTKPDFFTRTADVQLKFVLLSKVSPAGTVYTSVYH